MVDEIPMVSLADLCDAKRGITYGVVKPGDHVTNGVPILRADNVGNGRVETTGLLRIDPAIERAYSRSRLRGGEVLVTLVGAYFGKIAVAGPAEIGVNTARAVGVVPVNVDARYVGYALRSPACQRYIRQRATTTAQPTLNLRDLATTPVPWPDGAQRSAIGHILGTLDDKIELNRKMNETLEEMARALFKSWFVDFDPVHAKAAGKKPYGMDDATAALFPDAFEDSELGPIPAGWEVEALSRITSKIGSGATPRGGGSAYVAEGVAFIRSQNVYDGRFVWNGVVRLTDEDAYRLRSVAVQTGDVLMNITGDSILRTCIVDPSVLPARVNQHVAIIRPAGVGSRFLHEWLVRPDLKAYLLGHSAGATRKAITKGHLENTPVLVPAAAVHDEFLSRADAWGDKRMSNNVQARTLADLRDTLLPKLLSGELRIKDAEQLVGEVA